MVKSKQLKVGNETEQIIADYFQSLGFWVYILPKKIGGQPFDIIASKDKETWFVDAKHLEQNKASFSFERIEPNQKTAMKIATERANMANVGFFIYWDRNPDRLYYMLEDKVGSIPIINAHSVVWAVLDAYCKEGKIIPDDDF